MSKTGILTNMKNYLDGVNKKKLLADSHRVQILLGREVHDMTALRTEATRELNTFPTPTSVNNLDDVILRIVFLPSKQKAAEARRFGEILRTLLSDQDLSKPECYYNQNLCVECPRCLLFGATNVRDTTKPNIKHRIQYASAFSLLPYEEVESTFTFNAIDDVTTETGQALYETSGVSPANTFMSIVTLKDPSVLELVLYMKTLLSTNRYGAETRLYGTVRNRILGIVFGMEEIITPLELTLEASDLLEKNKNIDPPAVNEILENYKSMAAFPDKITIIDDIESFIKEIQEFNIDKQNLEKMYEISEGVKDGIKEKS